MDRHGKGRHGNASANADDGVRGNAAGGTEPKHERIKIPKANLRSCGKAEGSRGSQYVGILDGNFDDDGCHVIAARYLNAVPTL